MANVIITSSRYILLIVFALFVYQSFKMDLDVDEKKKNSMHSAQLAMNLIIHSVAFLVIGMVVYIKKEEEGVASIIILYTLLFTYYVVFNLVAPLLYKEINRGLVSAMSMFLCVGFIELTRLSFDKATKQFIILLVATVIFFLMPALVKILSPMERMKWVFCVLGLGLLLFVLVAGRRTNGALLAITIGPISFQPLEFVKILYILFVAGLFKYCKTFKDVLVSLGFTLAFVLILVLSRDLGSALIIFVVYLFLLYTATKKGAYLGLGAVALSGAAALSFSLFSHVRVRFMAWIDPWTDIDAGGYQITQSLFAIGTGGWIGLGIYQGMPYKIPEVSQDFMFSAICEELGGLFAILLILLCACVFVSIMRIAMIQAEMFSKLVVLGLGVGYGIQLFLTIGGAMKMIPSTGVTLPLVSSGGSSLIATMVTFGLIEGFYLKALKEAREEKLNRKHRELDELEDELYLREHPNNNDFYDDYFDYKNDKNDYYNDYEDEYEIKYEDYYLEDIDIDFDLEKQSGKKRRKKH